MIVEKTTLEEWISKKVHGASDAALTRDAIERYQLKKINETMKRIRSKSRYYKSKLEGICDKELTRLEDIAALPFTEFSDLSSDPTAFACEHPSDISRIMTVTTSGTTGPHKRIFYTEEDMESTLDFFHHGMANLVCEGDRVLILLPGELPGSVGDLLERALARLGAVGIKHGVLEDAENTAMVMEKENVNVIVGLPIHVLELARMILDSRRFSGKIKSVLLNSDYVSDAIVKALEETWRCKVFSHYGAAEMGLGTAVQCSALCGYHYREADLYIEIIDMETCDTVKDGEFGEIVVTSLTAKGTPFLRYRTGDIGRFLTEPCPCGTVLKSLDKVQGRKQGKIMLDSVNSLQIREFDEALFPITELADFRVTIGSENESYLLFLEVNVSAEPKQNTINRIYDAVAAIPAISLPQYKDRFKIQVQIKDEKLRQGVFKRRIIDHRGF